SRYRLISALQHPKLRTWLTPLSQRLPLSPCWAVRQNRTLRGWKYTPMPLAERLRTLLLPRGRARLKPEFAVFLFIVVGLEFFLTA
ncbi:MAG: hypothetical protein ACUVRR_11140, partial [Candidatus Fervidibacter sp.]|uniref:hypothetical protein n=1 Tax=Candidatus Fervidibacter sp. TaxID=3100871 RepID=UPI00404A6A98